MTEMKAHVGAHFSRPIERRYVSSVARCSPERLPDERNEQVSLTYQNDRGFDSRRLHQDTSIPGPKPAHFDLNTGTCAHNCADRPAARGYRFEDELGVGGWVRARSRGRARFLITRAIREAGYARCALDALRMVRSLRLDPRADSAPVLGRGDEGLVPTTWAPAGGAP